ncbi:unnamed protein product, partial [Prorocentrum cordatum]
MARSPRGGGSGSRRGVKCWMCSCGGWNWDWRTTCLGCGHAAPQWALEAAAKAKPQADKGGWVDQPRGRRAQRQARGAATSAATSKSQTSVSGASGTPSGSDATAIERLQVAVEQLEALQAGPPDGVDCCFTGVVASQPEAKCAELADAQRAAAEANDISKAEKRLRAARKGLEQKQAACGIAEAQLQKAQEELAQLDAEVEEASRALHVLKEEARVEAAALLRQRAAEWAGASQVSGLLIQLDKLPEAWGSSNFEVAWAAIRAQVEAVRAQLAEAPAAPRRVPWAESCPMDEIDSEDGGHAGGGRPWRPQCAAERGQAERRGDANGEWPKVAQACKRELAAEAEDVRCGLEETRLAPHRLEEARGAVLRSGFSAFLHAPAPTDKEGPLANSGGVATLARSDLQAAGIVWATPSGLRHRFVGVTITAASGLLALARSLCLQDALGPKGINLDIFAAFGDLKLSEGRPWLALGDFNMEPGALRELGWPRVQRGTYLGPAERTCVAQGAEHVYDWFVGPFCLAHGVREASALDGFGRYPHKPVWLLLQDVRPDALVQVLVRPGRFPGVDAVGCDVTLLVFHQGPRSVAVVGMATESFGTNGTGLAGSPCATFEARLPGLAALRTASAGGRPLVGARIVVGDIAMQAVGTEQLVAARLRRAGLEVAPRLRVQHPPLGAAQSALLASRPSLGRQLGVRRKSQGWPFRKTLQVRNIGTDAANERRGVHEGRVRAAGALPRARRLGPFCKAGPTASAVCSRMVTGNADGEPRRWKLAACRSAGALPMGAERGLGKRCAELRRRRNLAPAALTAGHAVHMMEELLQTCDLPPRMMERGLEAAATSMVASSGDELDLAHLGSRELGLEAGLGAWCASARNATRKLSHDARLQRPLRWDAIGRQLGLDGGPRVREQIVLGACITSTHWHRLFGCPVLEAQRRDGVLARPKQGAERARAPGGRAGDNFGRCWLPTPGPPQGRRNDAMWVQCVGWPAGKLNGKLYLYGPVLEPQFGAFRCEGWAFAQCDDDGNLEAGVHRAVWRDRCPQTAKDGEDLAAWMRPRSESSRSTGSSSAALSASAVAFSILGHALSYACAGEGEDTQELVACSKCGAYMTLGGRSGVRPRLKERRPGDKTDKGGRNQRSLWQRGLHPGGRRQEGSRTARHRAKGEGIPALRSQGPVPEQAQVRCLEWLGTAAEAAADSAATASSAGNAPAAAAEPQVVAGPGGAPANAAAAAAATSLPLRRPAAARAGRLGAGGVSEEGPSAAAGPAGGAQ